MAKYSRMQKYQELRDQIEEETTVTEKPVGHQNLSRLSRMDNQSRLNHANQPTRPYTDRTATSRQSKIAKSPVMDNLIDEVKQYNIDNGNLVSDDTQINILKQLDGTQVKHRNRHFIPLEEEDEELGSTMKLPVSEIGKTASMNAVASAPVEPEDPTPSILPVHAPEPKPVVQPEPEPEEIKEEKPIKTEPVKKEESSTKDKIILTSDDIEDDNMVLDSTEEQEYSRPKAKETRKQKKAKKKKVKAKKAHKTEMPSEKIQEVEVSTQKKKGNTAGTILNVILIILIILLFIAIGATIYFIRTIGA